MKWRRNHESTYKNVLPAYRVELLDLIIANQRSAQELMSKLFPRSAENQNGSNAATELLVSAELLKSSSPRDGDR